MRNVPLKRQVWRVAGLMLGAAVMIGWSICGQRDGEVQAESVASAAASPHEDSIDGRELFQRSWLPDDPRSPEGDGLGPMFNETSCAGCHNQGGPGGAGPASKNVELLTAFVATQLAPALPPFHSPSDPRFLPPPSETISKKAIVKELMKVHPGFEKEASVVVHRFGTSAKHAAWRSQLLNSQPQFTDPINVNNSGTFSAPFGTPVAQVDFEPAPPSIPQQPEPAAAQASDNAIPSPGQAPGETGPAPSVPEEPTPFVPSDAPATQPVPQPVQRRVPSVTFPTFQQAPQFGNASTGIPLVDEALQEMRRLQQEARSDLSGSTNRGRVVLLRSQRNTSALFGAGVIDAIPDSVIEAAAKQKHEDFPRVSGRIHQLADQKIGKFGWKAQKASLRDFTLAACANELGLDVPEHAQPDVPYEKDRKRKGHDMTEKEADVLVAYVRSLPAPIQDLPKEKQAANQIEEGREVFESAGCAVCHTPDMGDAKGVYSDFLLHDMGEQLQASGSYGSILTPQEFDPLANDGPTTGSPQPGDSAGEQASQPGTQPQNRINTPAAATSAEWRTPPLWGIRDSAPYLHDGRAATLEQAIALHGGEGSDAAIRYFMMPQKKRQRMIAFLKTLRAPEQHAAAP